MRAFLYLLIIAGMDRVWLQPESAGLLCAFFKPTGLSIENQDNKLSVLHPKHGILSNNQEKFTSKFAVDKPVHLLSIGGKPCFSF